MTTPTALNYAMDAMDFVSSFKDRSGVVGDNRIPYSQAYDQYLDFFKMVANLSSVGQVRVRNIPTSWAPLLLYIGAEVLSTIRVWDCDVVDWIHLWGESEDKRLAVEISSAARPELVHALFLLDTQEWPWKGPTIPQKNVFPVTCNGSYFRPEVVRFMQHLQNDYAPPCKKAVLVPCSADKPYPAAVHRAVLALLPTDWHIINATGVVGLVPQELWCDMPHYDSGLPNQFRVQETVRWYFARWPYEGLIVYSDFYAQAVSYGLEQLLHSTQRRMVVRWPFGNHFRTSYANLCLPEHLRALEADIAEVDRQIQINKGHEE